MSWNLEGTTATLDVDGATAQLDLSQPKAGVSVSLKEEGAIEGHLFAWRPQAGDTPRLPLIESYIRENDLVALYGPTDAFPFETEVYWRALPLLEGAKLRLSMIVSIETSLLDTEPEIVVQSAWPQAELQDSDHPGARLYRNSSAGHSCWEAIAPSDQVEDADPEADGSHLLFSHFLEKGVIRRAMLTSAVLASDQDRQAARLCYEDFLERPLPLTT